MAVRAILCSFLDGDCLELERYKDSREGVREFMQAISSTEAHLEKFDDFSARLTKALEKCFFSCISDSSSVCRSKYVQREKVWGAFHEIRTGSVRKLWQDFFGQGFPRLHPVVYQHVTQKLYSDLICCHLSSKFDDHTVKVPSLTSDEENILRYAAGYVPFKLLKEYEKKPPSESVMGVVECLSGMAVNGEDGTILEYTKKWIELVDRGGLFELSDVSYCFFKEVEIQVRKKLLVAFNNTVLDTDLKESIISSITLNDDIQFYWTILSADIENEDEATKVLKKIIGLWLTVRGHSIAGTCLEQYKHKSKASNKKKGLRTELKRSSK